MSTCRRMWTDRQVRSMAVDSVENKEDLKVFEHIVDKDGHKRFVEGDITIETIAGVTQTYGKWSLSGSHLMIVLALDVANGTEIASGSILAKIKNIPAWIMSKIVVLFSTYALDRKSFAFYGSDYTSQSVFINLLKVADDELDIQSSNLTLTAVRKVRIQFDLLIDNE